MTFAWPHLLWLLFVPLALLGWELTHLRRVAVTSHPKILQAEAGSKSLTLSPFAPGASTRRNRVRGWLCAGLLLGVVALARPQWGRLEEPVFDQSREILLAVDLSRSMLTPDVRPSRLDRAKLLIQSLLEKLAGERVGLVVFSGTAFLQSPLSADYEILREFLPSLNPDYLPQGGSNYTALIDSAIDAFGEGGSADRFLIILSDGEATDDGWRARIEELKTKGIRVIGLGVGTAAGSMIPDGTGGFVKDERGAVVRSKLESDTLGELAHATNGVYQDASSWVDLPQLMKETVETGRKGAFVEKNTVRYVERFQWPLALALWCLLVSFYYEFPVRPRVRDLKLASGSTAAKAEKSQVAATVATVLFLLVVATVPRPALAAVAPQVPLIPTPSASSPAEPAISTETPPANEPPMLAKVVARLSAADTQSAKDWVELGKETLLWGSRLLAQQQAVPEGPVRDALAGVDLGTKLDAKAADWPKLRDDLEALLKKSEDQKKDQQQQQQNQQKQDQDQKQSDDQQKSQQKDSQSQDQKQPSPQDQKEGDPKQQKESPQPQDAKQQQDQKQGSSAFGDMQDRPPPPPPPGDTQKVGGNQDKKQEPKQLLDPALALPMQKLDQVRNQDSPARLFQLMEADKKPPTKPGKDW